MPLTGREVEEEARVKRGFAHFTGTTLIETPLQAVLRL